MIEGTLFEQGSAVFTHAVLTVNNDVYQVKTEVQTVKQGGVDEVKLSDRLGNVQRKLTLEDGSVFATYDNDAIDKLFISKNKTNSFIHKFESNISFVLISLIVTIVLSLSFFKWGVPLISSGIAEALPQKTNEIIGAHTFDFLDEYVFKESTLDKERRNSIRTHFKQKLVPSYESDGKITFTLHFRDWSDGNQGIPNALALPSGDIILTDKFIELSENQDEIDAVLLHEMGHIAHRHSLKLVIQSTIVTTAIMMITGDVSGIADIGIGIGSLLLSANYSRDYEAEADQFAFSKMLEINIDPISFAKVMKRITDYSEDMLSNKQQESNPMSKEKPSDFAKKDASSSGFDSKITNYFSTHPATKKRTENAERYSKCFKQGLKTCE